MNKIWALGCSFTRGTAVPSELCWVSILSQMIGEPIDNLGIEGASPKRVWQYYQELRADHQPLLTIIQWPGTVRDTLYVNNQVINLGLWNVNEYPRYKQQLLRGQVQRQNDQLIARAKLALTEPAVHFDVRTRFHPFIDLAADQLHPGPQTHQQIAQWVYQELVQGPAVHIARVKTH